MRVYVFILGVLATFLLGWIGIVGIPAAMLGRVAGEQEAKRYTAEQLHGRSIYIREGCMYCHSQQPRAQGFGGDQQRLWGRASVPADYVYDRPHLLGTMRTGPDLFNIAARQPSQVWHSLHLFNPRLITPGSVMPRYPWLFAAKFSPAPGETPLNLPDSLVRGNVVVLTDEGNDLVAYLLSLDHTTPILMRRNDSTRTSQ